MSTTNVAASKPAAESPQIQDFFDSIAGKYDHLNQVLSFRLDDAWRRGACQYLVEGHETAILDLGVGTGKFLELFLDKPHLSQFVGLDFSQGMLRSAKQQKGSEDIHWISGDFHHLPFGDETFDLIISSFTLRSVQDMSQFLKENFRLLRSKGKVGFLCLTRPRSTFWRALSYPYLKYYLPLVGGFLTGQRDAYRFLSESILTFQEPKVTLDMMQEVGFSEVGMKVFSFGLATLLIGRKV